MSAMASQITGLPIVYSTVYSGADQRASKSVKAPRHWPLWGEFTGDRWIPRTKGQSRRKCSHFMTSSCEAETECLFLGVYLHAISSEVLSSPGIITQMLKWAHNWKLVNFLFPLIWILMVQSGHNLHISRRKNCRKFFSRFELWANKPFVKLVSDPQKSNDVSHWLGAKLESALEYT